MEDKNTIAVSSWDELETKAKPVTSFEETETTPQKKSLNVTTSGSQEVSTQGSSQVVEPLSESGTKDSEPIDLPKSYQDDRSNYKDLVGGGKYNLLRDGKSVTGTWDEATQTFIKDPLLNATPQRKKEVGFLQAVEAGVNLEAPVETQEEMFGRLGVEVDDLKKDAKEKLSNIDYITSYPSVQRLGELEKIKNSTEDAKVIADIDRQIAELRSKKMSDKEFEGVRFDNAEGKVYQNFLPAKPVEEFKGDVKKLPKTDMTVGQAYDEAKDDSDYIQQVQGEIKGYGDMVNQYMINKLPEEAKAKLEALKGTPEYDTELEKELVQSKEVENIIPALAYGLDKKLDALMEVGSNIGLDDDRLVQKKLGDIREKQMFGKNMATTRAEIASSIGGMLPDIAAGGVYSPLMLASMASTMPNDFLEQSIAEQSESGLPIDVNKAKKFALTSTAAQTAMLVGAGKVGAHGLNLVGKTGLKRAGELIYEMAKRGTKDAIVFGGLGTVMQNKINKAYDLAENDEYLKQGLHMAIIGGMFALKEGIGKVKGVSKKTQNEVDYLASYLPEEYTRKQVEQLTEMGKISPADGEETLGKLNTIRAIRNQIPTDLTVGQMDKIYPMWVERREIQAMLNGASSEFKKVLSGQVADIDKKILIEAAIPLTGEEMAERNSLMQAEDESKSMDKARLEYLNERKESAKERKEEIKQEKAEEKNTLKPHIQELADWYSEAKRISNEYDKDWEDLPQEQIDKHVSDNEANEVERDRLFDKYATEAQKKKAKDLASKVNSFKEKMKEKIGIGTHYYDRIHAENNFKEDVVSKLAKGEAERQTANAIKRDSEQVNPFTRDKQQGEVGGTETFDKDGNKITDGKVIEPSNKPNEKPVTPTAEGGTIQVKQFAKGDGGTKGVFEDANGKLYKSILPQSIQKTEKGFERKPIEGAETKEHEILSELQDNPHIPKIGKVVETSEGKAFEIEKLDEIEKYTPQEYGEIVKILDDLNNKGYFVGDKVTVMRRPSTGELVVVDFSSGYKNENGLRHYNDGDASGYLTGIRAKMDKNDVNVADYNQHLDYEINYAKKNGVDNNELSAPKTKGYQYKLLRRPVGIGTHPTEGFEKVISENNKSKEGHHAVVEYSRPLSAEEVKNYELEYSGRSKDIYSLNDKVDKAIRLGAKKVIVPAGEGEKVEPVGVGEKPVEDKLVALEKEYEAKPVEELVALKKKLYGDADIESPMSPEEKLLNKVVAKKFSDKNQEIRAKHEAARKAKEDTPQVKKQKTVNSFIDKVTAYNEMSEGSRGKKSTKGARMRMEIKDQAKELGIHLEERGFNFVPKTKQGGSRIRKNYQFEGNKSEAENHVPLEKRSKETQELFDLMDNGGIHSFPDVVGADGKRLSNAQKESAIDDIRNGRNTKAADALLNVMDKANADGFIEIRDATLGTKQIDLDVAKEHLRNNEDVDIAEEGQDADAANFEMLPERERDLHNQNINDENRIDNEAEIGRNEEEKVSPSVDNGTGKKESKPTEEVKSNRIQSAKEKLQAAKEKAKAIRDAKNNLKAVDDPFEQAKREAEADRDVFDAYVELAKEYIKQGLKNVEDFAKELGEKVEDVKSAWEEAIKEGKKKTLVAERAYEGKVREGVKNELEKIGLTRDIDKLDVAEAKAKEFVSKVGEENALNAIRNGDVDGATAAFVFKELAESLNRKAAIETDATEVARLEKLQAELLDEWGNKQWKSGAFNSAMQKILVDSELNFNSAEKAAKWEKEIGEKPSDELMAKWKAQDAEIKELNKKLAEAELKAKEAEGKQAISDIKESIEREKKSKRYTAKAKEVADGIRRLKNKPIELRDENGNIIDLTTLGVSWNDIVESVAKAIEAGGKIADALDDALKGVKWYDNLTDKGKMAVRAQIESAIRNQAPSEGIEKANVPHSLIRELVEGGIDNIDDLVKAVQIKYPKLSEREVRDAITGYGKISNPNKEEVEVKIRKMKRIGKAISALEDIANKKRPLRSGQQRDKLDAQERALNKELREAMKDLPVDAETEAQQLKTSLDAVKQRLQNQIEDLNREIETGEKTPVSERKIEYDSEAKALAEERDRVKAIHDEIFGKTELTDEQRINIATKALEKSISNLEEKLKTGDILPKKAESKTPETPELKALREKRDKLQEEIRELRDATKVKKSPQEIATENAIEANRKSIEEKERRIRENDLSPTPKKEVADKNNAELKALRTKNEALDKQLQKLRNDAKVKRDASIVATEAAIKSIERRTKDIQDRIRNNELEKAKKPSLVKNTPEYQKAKKKLEAEAEKLKKLQEAAGIPDKKRVELAKKAAERRIEDLQRRLRDGDFSKKKSTPLQVDSELIKLRAEKLRIKEEYEKEFYKAKLKNRTTAEWIKDSVWELWAIPRVLMATGEMSFVGIQGLKQSVAHPLTAARAFKNALTFMKSEKNADNWLRNIKSQEWYPTLRNSKLALTEPHAELSAREELFYSGWSNLVWDGLGRVITSPARLKSADSYLKAQEGWSKLNPLKALERGAVGYLDTIRVERFLSGAEMLKEQGKTFENSPQDYKDVADAINTMTGRASLGGLEQQADLLSKVFFSPRNWASGIKTATPYALIHFGKMTPTARKMAISDFSKFVGLTTGMVMMAAAKLNNDDDKETGVEFDPRSTDFMKIKLGNTRVDPWGGMQQQVVLSSRLMADGLMRLLPQLGIEGGYKKDMNVMPLGISHKSPSAGKILGQQALNKLNPTADLLYNYLNTTVKKDGTRVNDFGQEYTVKSELEEKFHPIFWSTVSELLKDDPNALNGLLAFYAFFGGGVNVYANKNTTTPKPKFKFKSTSGFRKFGD